ncbi:MAG: phospholipase D-like domain-containing protein [Terriglobia bacterium]
MWKSSTEPRILFSRSGSVADYIERSLLDARQSVDAALYRLDLPRLARALLEVKRKTLRLRLILDWGKYHQSAESRELVARNELPVRLCGGRKDGPSKMHHKFAIIDGRVALTGSYNWTKESELSNYENLVVIAEPRVVANYTREFESLWEIAKELKAPPALKQ